MPPEELYWRCKISDEFEWEYAYNYMIRYLERVLGAGTDYDDLAQESICYFLDSDRMAYIKELKAFKKLLRMKAMCNFLDLRSYMSNRPAELLYQESHDGNRSYVQRCSALS